MSAAKRSAAPDTLAQAGCGDVLALSSDCFVDNERIFLAAGSLVRIGWVTSAGDVFARHILPAGSDAGEWSDPYRMPGNAACRLVSTVTDRRGVVADGQPVQDPADARGGR